MVFFRQSGPKSLSKRERHPHLRSKRLEEPNSEFLGTEGHGSSDSALENTCFISRASHEKKAEKMAEGGRSNREVSQVA